MFFYLSLFLVFTVAVLRFASFSAASTRNLVVLFLRKYSSSTTLNTMTEPAECSSLTLHILHSVMMIN